jgi:transposase-like protein
MISTQLKQALIYLLASPPPVNCPHDWVKNGTKNGLQRYRCKHCKLTKTEGDRLKGRQKSKK